MDKIEEFKTASTDVINQWNISEIPKNHIFATHVGEYLALNEETLWTSADENVEACHQLVKRRSRRHGLDNNKKVSEGKRKNLTSLMSIYNTKNKRF